MAPIRGGPGPLSLQNIQSGETVHQRCIIVKGTCEHGSSGHVTVQSGSPSGGGTFPDQAWPLVDGKFTALVLLSSGLNSLTFRRSGDGDTEVQCELKVTYIPLVETPPLHLAIMVAKDSPLLIDCPPIKHGGISSAHSSLDAAIAKFRMTAYMWQALTAEDMRMKGLKRRSFRLEEEWSADTTSSAFVNASREEELFAVGGMRATAKVHLIPSEHTVKEIRDSNMAQQNGQGQQRDSLHAWFTDAIKDYAKTHPSFSAAARPVVAGMILDSHYSRKDDLILGHAALGAHNPTGLSLGIMGSHLTYAWPRFLEEVTACLLDSRQPGESVGNDNDECGTLWEACSVGQGAFLHEVGHAFGAPHTTGIMARGYPVHWPRNFVSKTAWCARDNVDGFVVVENENEARWDLKDALGFAFLPHFWLPGDDRAETSQDQRTAAPTVVVRADAAREADADAMTLQISSPVGLARIQWNGQTEATPSVVQPTCTIHLSEQDLETRFPREEPLRLSVVAMNGRDRTIRNVWRLFSMKTFVRVPGADYVLNKRSVMTKNLENRDGGIDDKAFWTWATMLQKKNADGTLSHATKVDVRTGCILDGAYVYYDDDSRVNCGPRFGRWKSKGEKQKTTFGGHASEEVAIPEGHEIVNVEVSRVGHVLHGIRLTLSDGTKGGQLSGGGQTPETLSLAPTESERIVGFYGRSYWGEMFDGVVEFGILTAPKGVELPDSVYTMTELQNLDGTVGDADYWESDHDEDVDESFDSDVGM